MSHPPTFTYNAENQLVCTGPCASGVSYAYDGDGRRVMKSNGTIYWYGTGSDPLLESDLLGNWKFAHYYFNGMRVARREASNGWLDHYGLDALGNARLVYGYNGGWDQSDFYPFGGERVIGAAAGSKFKFTGKERDSESGLDNFGARYYSSSMGRFASADWSSAPEPVPYANFRDPQSLNLYAYVGNNPLSHADPDGHCDPDGKHYFWQKLGNWFKGNGFKTNLQLAPQGTVTTVQGASRVINNSPQFTRREQQMIMNAMTLGFMTAMMAGDAMSAGGEGEEEGAVEGEGIAASESEGVAAEEGAAAEEGTALTHGEQWAAEAAVNPSRQVGDPNRVVREGRVFTDTETGNTLNVRGNRVVIRDSGGNPVTQFKNSRANTQARVQSGRWCRRSRNVFQGY